jgi:hypothetical protein
LRRPPGRIRDILTLVAGAWPHLEGCGVVQCPPRHRHAAEP